MGSGIGGIGTIEANYRKYAEAASPRKISPFFVPGSIINMISGHVSIQYGFTGPNLALVTACTTSTHCIGIAGRVIAYGDADVMIAGGAEYATTTLGLGGFCANATTTRRRPVAHGTGTGTVSCSATAVPPWSSRSTSPPGAVARTFSRNSSASA